jgi:hypothetical protein
MRALRFVVVAGLLGVASRVSGESLGEVAAREQARRQAARRADAPVAVVHEEELRNATGRIANDPTIAPAAALPPVGASGLVAAPHATDDVRGREIREAFWRAEARRRRSQAASAEQALKDVERWADPTYAGKDRPSCPITRRTDRRKARADAARARQALDSLEEDARVGGALPGWVRE